MFYYHTCFVDTHLSFYWFGAIFSIKIQYTLYLIVCFCLTASHNRRDLASARALLYDWNPWQNEKGLPCHEGKVIVSAMNSPPWGVFYDIHCTWRQHSDFDNAAFDNTLAGYYCFLSNAVLAWVFLPQLNKLNNPKILHHKPSWQSRQAECSAPSIGGGETKNTIWTQTRQRLNGKGKVRVIILL